jgi:hypothetical protein
MFGGLAISGTREKELGATEASTATGHKALMDAYRAAEKAKSGAYRRGLGGASNEPFDPYAPDANGTYSL